MKKLAIQTVISNLVVGILLTVFLFYLRKTNIEQSTLNGKALPFVSMSYVKPIFLTGMGFFFVILPIAFYLLSQRVQNPSKKSVISLLGITFVSSYVAITGSYLSLAYNSSMISTATQFSIWKEILQPTLLLAPMLQVIAYLFVFVIFFRKKSEEKLSEETAGIEKTE